MGVYVVPKERREETAYIIFGATTSNFEAIWILAMLTGVRSQRLWSPFTKLHRPAQNPQESQKLASRLRVLIDLVLQASTKCEFPGCHTFHPRQTQTCLKRTSTR